MIRINKNISPVSWSILINNFFISFAVSFINPYFIISMENDFKIRPSTGSIIVLSGMILGTFISYILTTKSKQIIVTGFNAHFLLTFTFVAFAAIYYSNSYILKMLMVFLIYSSYRMGLMLATNCNRILHLNTNQEESVGSVFALRNTLAAFGSILGPIIAGQIYKLYGYLPLIILTAILFLLTTLIYYHIKQKYSNLYIETKENETYEETKNTSSAELLIIISFTFIGIFNGQVFSFIPLALKEGYKDYSTLISLLYSVNAFILISGSIPITSLLSKYLNQEKRYFFSIVLYSLGYIIFSIFPSNIIIFYTFIICISLGELLFSVTSMEIIRSLNSKPQAINHAISKYNLINSIAGIGLGQFLGALLIDNSLEQWSFIFWIAVGIAAYILYKFGKRSDIYGKHFTNSTKYGI